MMTVVIDDRVQLKQDIPELGLHRGDEGVVCSAWFSPAPTYYEVQFDSEQSTFGIRALLISNQLQKPTEPNA